jgi:hypothetical protein
MAARLAEKHKIPVTDIRHPWVKLIQPDGTEDTWMQDKLRYSDDGNYVPYCLRGTGCGRLHKTEYGFKCPTCGNKANYDLTRYNGNLNVVYEPGHEPKLTIQQWNEQVEARKKARHERRLNK